MASPGQLGPAGQSNDAVAGEGQGAGGKRDSRTGESVDSTQSDVR